MSGDSAVRQGDTRGHRSAARQLLSALMLLAPLAAFGIVAGASSTVDEQLSSLVQAVEAKRDVIGAPTEIFAALPMVGEIVIRTVSAVVPAVIAGLAIALIWVFRQSGRAALTSEDMTRKIVQVASAVTAVLVWKPAAALTYSIGASLIRGLGDVTVIGLVAAMTMLLAVLSAAALIGLVTLLATEAGGFRDPVCFPSIGPGDLSAFIAPNLRDDASKPLQENNIAEASEDDPNEDEGGKR